MRKLPKKIIDEYTNRDDLTAAQKWYRRNPERVKARYTKTNKTRYAHLTVDEYELKKQKERLRWAEMPTEKKTEKNLKRCYGMTYAEYHQMLQIRDFLCDGCQRPVVPEHGPDRGVVDHCHSTKIIRGILCNHCNQALGLINDSVSTLIRLSKYVGRHK